MFKIRIFWVLLLVFGCCACWSLPQANAKYTSPTDKKTGAGKSIKTITVVHGAVTNNMKQLPVTNGKGHQNWGCVKADGSYVWVMVTLSHNDTATINAVDWHGQGAPLSGYDNRYRQFGKDEVKKYTVKPTLNSNGLSEIYIWVIWATYQIRITGNLDDSQHSTYALDGNWLALLGGGSSLGPADVCSHPTLTYRYAVGRTQGIAYLTPAGVEQRVNPSSWQMRRQKVSLFYDNGSLGYKNPAYPAVDPDNSNSSALDLNPTDNPSQGPPNTIYDVDAPGCPLSAPTGNESPADPIDHTAEHYANYDSWASIILNGEYRCSDFAEWSHKARLDADRIGPCNTTVVNQVTASHIDISNPRFYDPR